jgi:hypothetical protein
MGGYSVLVTTGRAIPIGPSVRPEWGAAMLGLHGFLRS